MDHNTEIIAITDRSGSMHSIKNDAIGGFDTFIADQRAQPGNVRVTSVIFDTVVETQYTALPISEVPSLVLEPRGSTALYDAIGQTLTVHGERITKEAWAHLVIVVIITDGNENASREYTQARIKEMITHAQAHEWKFVFLAANQDAFAAGASMGVSASTTMGYEATDVGTRSVYASASTMTKSLRSVSAAAMGLNTLADVVKDLTTPTP